MNYFRFFFFLLVCVGCGKEGPKPKIEIYLLNKVVESNECVRFRETSFYTRLDSIHKKWYGDRYIDTISEEFMDGPKFEVEKEDLEIMPFIKDTEILAFNAEMSVITFDSIVRKRLRELHPEISQGKQFAITVDKEPVLTGYFWNLLSSQTCHWYSIYNVDINDLNINGDLTQSYWIGHFNDGHYLIKEQKSKRPPYPKELIEAFRASGRLIEE